MVTLRLDEEAHRCAQSEAAASAPAEHSHAISLEPGIVSGPPASALSEQPRPQNVQEQQKLYEQKQQHRRAAESTVPGVDRQDETLEEPRQVLISRLARNKAYGAYLLHQAGLRRQRDLREKLTRHDYSAGIPVSSTHEAFATPSIIDTASVAAAAAAASTSRWLKQNEDPNSGASYGVLSEAGADGTASSLLRQHSCHGSDGYSASEQMLLHQKLLHQQQQCLLQQQKQQQLLREHQQQQTVLQQQQQQLLQHQQRLLECQQRFTLEDSKVCTGEGERAVCTGTTPAKPYLNDSSASTNWHILAPLPGQSNTHLASDTSALEPSLPIRHADASAATYPGAPACRIAATDADKSDADPMLSNKGTLKFPPVTPESPLHPALPPRLRRIPLPYGLVTPAAVLGMDQQQEQQLRQYHEEERRAYGEFLKRQIAQRKAAEKAEKELEKRLYGNGGARVIASSSIRTIPNIGTNPRSHTRYLNEGVVISSQAPPDLHQSASTCTTKYPADAPLATRLSPANDGPDVTTERSTKGPQGNEASNCSAQARVSVTFNKPEDATMANDVDGTRCSRHTPGAAFSRNLCSVSSPSQRNSLVERTSEMYDNRNVSSTEEADAAEAAAAAAKKRKQQEYREFLLMQIEQKQNERAVAGKKAAEEPAEHAIRRRNLSVETPAAEKRLRSRSCFSDSRAYSVNFEETPGNEAASASAPITPKGGEAAGRNGAPTSEPTDGRGGRKDVALFGSKGVGGRFNKSPRPSSSNRRVGDATEPEHLDGEVEERQRLLQEKERRMAYQEALLQQIREREEARERQRQEKLREQEKERLLTYEALERERRSMRTGRKAVNNKMAFTNKSSNFEESATAATTAGGDLDSPCHLTSAPAADTYATSEDCSSNVRSHRPSHVQNEGMPHGVSGPHTAIAAIKQSTPCNSTSAMTATGAAAALSLLSGSAVLPPSPSACRPQKQGHQCQVGLCRQPSCNTECLLSSAVTALQAEENAPELLGNLANCLHTVHLKIQKNQEELRSIKLQQQLAALQHRTQQNELTRFLSDLTHWNCSCTACTASAAAVLSAPPGPLAAKTGRNCTCGLQNPVMLQTPNYHDCLAVSCRAEECENTSAAAQEAAGDLLQRRSYTHEKGTAEEEMANVSTAGVAPVALARRVVPPEERTLLLEHESGRVPYYSSSDGTSVDPLFPGQYRCVHDLPHSHSSQHFLRHQEVRNQQQTRVHASDSGVKGLELRDSEINSADQKGVNSTAFIRGEEPRTAAEASSHNPGSRASGEVEQYTLASSPLRRQRSSRVNEVIESFTRWLKPSALRRKESQSLGPRRSSSVGSLASSEPSVLQVTAPEDRNVGPHSVTFAHSLPHQQEKQPLRTKSSCNAYNAEDSCDCSARSSPRAQQLQQGSRCFLDTSRAPRVRDSQVLSCPLLFPVARGSVPSFSYCSSYRGRGGCVNPFAARCEVHDCNVLQEYHLTHAEVGIATPSNDDLKRYCGGCSAAAPASAAPAHCSLGQGCRAVNISSPRGCCSSAINASAATAVCCHHVDPCGAAGTHKQTSTTWCHFHDTCTQACEQPQQCTAACCSCLCRAGTNTMLHCSRWQDRLQVPCMSNEPQPPQDETWIEGKPEQEQRFVHIREEDPLEAPSFACSIDEAPPERPAAKKVVPDFMRFLTGKDHDMTAGGVTLNRSLSLAPPANRFVLRRWLGGIVPPPPSKDFLPHPPHEEKTESEQDQEQSGKEEKHSLWKGRRNRAQHRGSVARTRSAAAASAAPEKSRRVTSTAGGSNSSDKVGEKKGRGKLSLRMSTAAAAAQAANEDAAALGAGSGSTGSSSGKGLLGLLGHMWDRRRRIENEKIGGGEEFNTAEIGMSERLKMRLSWDAEQPWETLLNEGATQGEPLLCATAAKLQRYLEEEEQNKRCKQQQERNTQQDQGRKHAQAGDAPDARDDKGATNGNIASKNKAGQSTGETQQVQSSGPNGSPPVEPEPFDSPFTSAPPSPIVPPEPHKKPKAKKHG